jgi:rod shape-determining protein MreC
LKVFKNKTVKVIFLIAVAVLLMLATFSDRLGLSSLDISGFVIKPVQSLFSNIGSGFGGTTNVFKENKQLKEERDKLQTQVSQLEKDIADLQGFKSRMTELENSLQLKEQFKDFNFLPADIIAKDAGNWTINYVINKGSNDGVVKDNVVVVDKGIVGRVIWAGTNTSKVQALTDPDCSISARISSNRSLVEVSGDFKYKDRGYCMVKYIDKDINISRNDYIETSGLQGATYPKGLLIGKVIQIENINTEPGKYAIIEPIVDFNKIEGVFVLTQK